MKSEIARILAGVSALALGGLTWSLTFTFSSIGGPSKGIDGGLELAGFWMPVLLFAVPQVLRGVLRAGQVVRPLWFVALAPLVGLANFALAFGLAYVFLPLTSQDWALRVSLVVATLISVLLIVGLWLKNAASEVPPGR